MRLRVWGSVRAGRRVWRRRWRLGTRAWRSPRLSGRPSGFDLSKPAATKRRPRSSGGRRNRRPGAERIMRRMLVGRRFALLGLMLWAGAAPAAMLAGTVVEVSGSCTARGRVLKPGDAVQVGDAVAVPAGGKLKLRMADGSMISIAPGSSMTVARYNVGRDAKLSL